MRFLKMGVALVATAMMAAPALAHHGLAQEFDLRDQAKVVLKGHITKVFWQNPHIYYSLEVQGADGKPRTYNIESVPVAFARNAGLTSKRLMGGGQPVEVTIRPALKNPQLGFGTYLKYADGFVVTFEGFKE